MNNLYVTPQDYKIAESNDISKDIVYSRVYSYGWDVDKAITTPVKKRDPEFAKWRKRAVKNGIPSPTFHSRKKAGWSYKEAATKPIMTRKQVAYKAAENLPTRIFTHEEIRRAEALGIPYGTLVARHRTYKWSKERAITTPVKTQFRGKKAQ